MARKKKSSLFEDMVDLVALLPWWGGVAIAAVSYFVLHKMATQPKLGAVQPGQVTQLMTTSFTMGLATVGQYLVPVVGLAGAAMSFIRRRQRRALIADVAQSKNVNALDGMSWREFEMLVGEAYALQGYRVTETGGGGADGGVDLVLTKGGEKFFVQCKQWKAYKVSVDVVRELYGVMAAKGAAGGFVVTSGRFTEDAKAFADGRNVQLVDGTALFAMIKRVKQSQATTQSEKSSKSVEDKVTAAPACPLCSSSMIKRTARKGANAGGEFWGCSKFPACRGVRPIA